MTLRQIKTWLRQASDDQVRNVMDAAKEEGIRRGWGNYWWE